MDAELKNVLTLLVGKIDDLRTDMAEVKADVAILKTDVAVLKSLSEKKLNRMNRL